MSHHFIAQLPADGDFGLTAHDPRPPPIIKIGPHNQTLPVDGVGLLQCQAEGEPDPLIRWYRNGRPLLMTDNRLTKLDSGTLQISGNELLISATFVQGMNFNSLFFKKTIVYKVRCFVKFLCCFML